MAIWTETRYEIVVFQRADANTRPVNHGAFGFGRLNMHYLWVFLLLVCCGYAFTPQQTTAEILPFAATTGGWLVGLLVLFIGTIVTMLVCNIIEEVGRKRNEHGSAYMGHDSHH
jgi:hypothetical protein